MGIVLKRRDNAPIVKDVYGGIIDILMKSHNIEDAANFLKESLQNMVDEKYGIDKADALFYENYPEFYEMVITSPTKNTTGADATSISSQQISINESLIAKIQTEDPYVTSLITNAWGVDRENNTFDRAAYNFQFRNTPATGGQKFRETVSLEESTKDAKVGLGWAAYNKFMQAFDIKVQKNGFDSYSSRGAGFLKKERDAWIEQQELINPVWFNEYSDGFESGKYKSTLR
jgi:hypothetical protein